MFWVIALGAMVVSAESAPGQVQDTAAASSGARVDALFADFSTRGSPGAAVVVAIGDSIVFGRGYGLADVEHGVAVTPSTAFRLASVTKQFTAAAILTL